MYKKRTYQNQRGYEHRNLNQRSLAGFESKDFKMHDVFLNFCRREKITVCLEMLGEVVRTGYIIGFDHQSIILENNSGQQLVYKKNLLTVNPKSSVNIIFSNTDPVQGFDLSGHPDMLEAESESGSEHAAHFA